MGCCSIGVSALRPCQMAYNRVYNSIDSLSIPDLIAMAHHPTSSRVLDAIFESSTVPQRARNKFVLRFVGHFHELVDDRIGSRVGDRMWVGSDPYLKVRHRASTVPDTKC